MIYIPFLADAFDNQAFPPVIWPVSGIFCIDTVYPGMVPKGILVRGKNAGIANHLSETRNEMEGNRNMKSIVMGYGRIGAQVGKLLIEQNHDVTIIDHECRRRRATWP